MVKKEVEHAIQRVCVYMYTRSSLGKEKKERNSRNIDRS